MNKIKFKNVFSKAFVVGLAAFAVSGMNVDAATVRENAGTVNEIENGAYIIGISRFTNDVTLTTGRVMTAEMNDVIFKGTAGYVKPPVYQYRGGNWISYDDENNSTLVSAEDVAKLGLNAQDIYYVNNVEKTLEIAYDANKATGCTFTTDAVGKKVTYSNGVLYVPATTKTITVTRNGEKVEELTKSETNENGDFVYNSNGNRYYGSISQDDIITTSGTTVNGETITFNGQVNWVNGKTANLGVDLNGTKTDTSGYRIGVKITAPTGVNLNNTINVYINGSKTPVAFTSSTTGDKGSFKFTPIVEPGKTYTVKVDWTEDFSQTFTIVVGNNFAAMPAGVVSGETVKITVKDDANKDKEVEVVSGTTGSTTNVTFSKIGDNKMPWDGKANINIVVNDNYAAPSFDVTGKVSAYYPNTKENDVGDVVEANETITLQASDVTYDSKTKTISIKNLKFSDDSVHRKIRVEIDWAGDESYVQPIDVVLDDATQFAYPSVRLENVKTQSDKSATPKYINWPVTDNKSVVSNNIVWNVGNHITAVIVPSYGTNNDGKEEYASLTKYTSEAELGRLQISVDGKILGSGEGKDFVPYTLKDASNNADLTSDILTDSNNASIYAAGNKVFALDLLLNKNNTSKKSNVKVLWDGDSNKVVGEFTIDYTNAIVNPQYEGAMSLESPYSYDGGSGVYSVYHTGTVEEEVNGSKVTLPAKIPFDYTAGANLVKVKFTGADATTKVFIGDKEITGTADGVYSIPVKLNEPTLVDVKWDDVNTQTFTVKLHESKGRLEAPAVGSISIGADANKVEGKDATISYNGDVAHSKFDVTTITTKEDATNNVTAGYVLPIDITAPAKASITNGTVKVTVSGGKYSADKDAASYGYKEYTATAGKITINPVISSKDDKLTVTVDWNGGFTETYNVNLNNANLVTGEGSLKASEAADANRSLSDFDGQINYVDEDNKYALELAITGAIDTGDDAVKVIDVITPEDKKTEGRNATVTGDKFTVSFDNANRRATVMIRWTNGYVGTYEINATKATIPTIILDSKLQKNEDGEYVVNAKVGENIGKIISSVLPNGAVAEATATGTATVDGKTVNVLNKLSDGSFEAAYVGTATIDCEMTSGGTAEPFTVKVVVSNNAVNATSTVAKEGNGLKVVTTPTGGTNSGYNIEFAYYELATEGNDKGKYVAKDINKVTVKDGANYVTTISAKTGELSDKYKLVITTKDSKLPAGNPGEAYANQTSVEVIERPSNVRYTVTFDSDGGDVYAPVTLEPADGANNTGIIADFAKYTPKKADGVSTNKLYTIKYEFTGWGLVVDGKIKLDEHNNPIVLESDTVITDSVTYKAMYDVTYVDKETGKEYTLDANGELQEITVEP